MCAFLHSCVAGATPRGSGFNALQDDYEPGNLGFDPLGLLKNADDAQVKVSACALLWGCLCL